MSFLELTTTSRISPLSAWLLAALVGTACAGCMTSGTFDNIPNHPVIESTSTRVGGPTPAGTPSSACPEYVVSAACPPDRRQCSYDNHGCEVCTCSQ